MPIIKRDLPLGGIFTAARHGSKIKRRLQPGAIGPRAAMDQNRLWRVAQQGGQLCRALAVQILACRHAKVVMRDAQGLRGGDFGVIPASAGVGPAEVDDAADAVASLPTRKRRRIGLRRTVKFASDDRMEIARHLKRRQIEGKRKRHDDQPR